MISRRLTQTLIVLVTGIALGMCCAAAEAQGAPLPAPATPDQSALSGTSGEDQLQEVIVTAERRTVNVQTTAISITAISGDTLAAQHLNTVADLQNVVPNMQVNTQGIGNYLEIRGVGTTAFIPTIVSGVGVFKDGMYEPSSIQIGDSFYDLANTQVLRGPQGTFGGFASIAGELDINTNNPSLIGSNSYIEAMTGSYSDHKIDGAVNLPVSDTFAMRLAFMGETRGSFYRDDGATLTCCGSTPTLDPGKEDSHSVRLGALWKPSDNFQALFKWEYTASDNGGFFGEPNQAAFTLPSGAPNTCPSGATGPVCHSPYYVPGQDNPFVLTYNVQDPLGTTFRDSTATLELRWTLPGDIVFRSLTGYWQDWWKQVGPNSNSAVNAGYTALNQPTEDHYQQEFDLISPTTGKVQWVVGATWFYRDAPDNVLVVSYTPPFTATTPEYVYTNANSVFHAEGLFANVNWQVLNSLQFQIGVRENADDNSTVPLAGPGGAGTQVAIPGLAGVPGFGRCTLGNPGPSYGCLDLTSQGRYVDKAPTGKVGLNWTPIPGQFLYAFYARGYQPGGYNGSSSFKPAYINDYELG